METTAEQSTPTVVEETSFLTALKTAYGSAIATETNNNSSERPTFDANSWNHQTMSGLLPIDVPFLGIAASFKVPRYSGIDSDSNYVSDSRNYVQEHFGLEHFRFYFADIGITKVWGYPRKSLQKNIYDYQFAPLASELEAFDVYMCRRGLFARVSIWWKQHYGADARLRTRRLSRGGGTGLCGRAFGRKTCGPKAETKHCGSTAPRVLEKAKGQSFLN